MKDLKVAHGDLLKFKYRHQDITLLYESAVPVPGRTMPDFVITGFELRRGKRVTKRLYSYRVSEISRCVKVA